ncbi:MAG TPA: hypothetical protein ENN58_00155 [bacterium]|nr:hypothetical protein [bacterium]
MTQHQKLDLLEAENKLQNIENNSRILHKKIRTILEKKEVTAEDIDEIYQFSEMLTDYFLTTDEILMNAVKVEDDD